MSESVEPAYRKPDALAAAYETAGGSIARTADQFDADYSTVRNYLIEYGIHDPAEQSTRTAETLEELDPEDLGLSPLDGGI